MFTQRHYKVIAKVIQEAGLPGRPGFTEKDGLVNLFCLYFSLENPRFNEEQFRRACGLEVK